MRTRPRRARLAALGLLLCAIAAGAVLVAVRAHALSWCEDCWQGTIEVYGQTISDAQCCITGVECAYIPDDFYRAYYSREYCDLYQDEEGGWHCGSGGSACYVGGGGGGGGGGGCQVHIGEGCPAQCFSCTYTY
jgi:uncharacterized membrane protein YgcG